MKLKSNLRIFLTLLLIGGLLCCPALAASSFPDVPENASYAEAVEYLNEIGIMQGDTNGKFNPDNMVTRAQMAAIICRMLGETENLTTDGTRFSDVPASYWANGYIVKAAELGIIGGYQDGTFKPDNTVTYEQAVTMVVRSVNLTDNALVLGGYPDGYIKVADEYGYLKDITVSKGDTMERKEIAMLIYNCLSF